MVSQKLWEFKLIEEHIDYLIENKKCNTKTNIKRIKKVKELVEWLKKKYLLEKELDRIFKSYDIKCKRNENERYLNNKNLKGGIENAKEKI